VLGSVKHPLSASDFSSFLLQAQASKAQVLGLANAGGDTINAIKAANEFGITKTMKMAGLLMFINDVHSLGLKLTQGMYLTDGWYWDMNAETRAWSKRYFAKMKKEPSMLQAADYSAATNYLKAVKATGTDDSDKVMAYMKKTKINDMFAKNGVIRPDGRMVHDMYLMQVKKPSESKYPWDYYKVVPPFRATRRTPPRPRPSARSGSKLSARNAAPALFPIPYLYRRAGSNVCTVMPWKFSAFPCRP
jgi:branched-chain amino acid transport system substrate-binding protein